jgi:hypothetical protein
MPAKCGAFHHCWAGGAGSAGLRGGGRLIRTISMVLMHINVHGLAHRRAQTASGLESGLFTIDDAQRAKRSKPAAAYLWPLLHRSGPLVGYTVVRCVGGKARQPLGLQACMRGLLERPQVLRHRQLANLFAHSRADFRGVAVVHAVVDARIGYLLHEVIDLRPTPRRAFSGDTGCRQGRHGTGPDLRL